MSSETLRVPQPSSANTEIEAQSEQSPPAESSSFNQTDLLKAVEVAEKDSFAIAESFTSLFDSLRLVLSEVNQSIRSLSHINWISIFDFHVSIWIVCSGFVL